MPDTASAAQQRVAQLLAENRMHAPPADRLLDLAAEVGKVASDALEACLAKYEARIDTGAGAGA